MGLKWGERDRFRARIVWLKSDQNGIEIIHVHLQNLHHSLVKIRPKWDWNLPGTSTGNSRGGLKSDQNGIEIVMFFSSFFLWVCVKIRPKWDWNVWVFVEDVVSEGLKSDQNGIEMWTCTGSSQRNWWLKSDQNGIEMRWVGSIFVFYGHVKIRPKWDWNP